MDDGIRCSTEGGHLIWFKPPAIKQWINIRKISNKYGGYGFEFYGSKASHLSSTFIAPCTYTWKSSSRSVYSICCSSRPVFRRPSIGIASASEFRPVQVSVISRHFHQCRFCVLWTIYFLEFLCKLWISRRSLQIRLQNEGQFLVEIKACGENYSQWKKLCQIVEIGNGKSVFSYNCVVNFKNKYQDFRTESNITFYTFFGELIVINFVGF